jgi:hypothetical protein
MIGVIGSRHDELIQLVEAIHLHLEGKTPLLVVESFDVWEPPVDLIEQIEAMHRIRTFVKVKSPYDKGGRPKNHGLSIHALMCRLQHMNPPCTSDSRS